MAGALTADEVIAFLDERAEWAVLTSIDRRGFPHSVPLGYFRIGEDVYAGTHSDTQKVRNLERDPHASLLIASAKNSKDWRGVLIQGEIEIVRDDAERLEIEREGRRQRGVPEEKLPTTPRVGEVMLRLSLQRTISWRF